ncbi:MAG: hydantoinase/oxoprolinase family protein [Alphaproteobacteria bacterium]|nr:hydantoinase/oxoprolinase family protein [Alphaproteobacteria bacterium]
MGCEIAADVGGTFTDFVVRDAAGRVSLYKSSTTPGRIADGIFDGLERIAARRDVSLSGLLAGCDSLAIGTTVATNAILEGKAAKTALICTAGFRDTLSIREGGKADSYNIYIDYPEPYIARHLTFGVAERINAEGGVEAPLDEAAVRAAIRQMKAWHVEAVAVALIWSIANPRHEQRIGQVLDEEWPGIPYSLSHRVSPSLREYRRFSATAIDASLKPVVHQNVAAIEGRLQAHGFAGVLTFVTSNGGRTATADILAKPVYLCLSGPSAGPHAGTMLARDEGIEGGNIVTIDMGGTSFDVSITTGWNTPMHREGVIGGHMFGVPSVDVRTIGAGGGSIARVDAGGFIHVGPASAGAWPGPACYGRGGTLPTVSDANLVLGLIDPAGFADGQIELSPPAAERAVSDHVAKPLGMDVRQAASLIALTVEQNMVAAIEEITVRRGIDPRQYLLVAGGSAAGLHAAAIARELGMKQVLVPAVAGVLSAYGIATGDVRFGYARALFTTSARFDARGVNAVLAELEADGTAYLDRMRVPPARRRFVVTAEARYAGQVWQLTLPLPRPRVVGAAGLAAVVEAFHVLHERHYAVRATDPVEFTEWNLLAIGQAVPMGVYAGDEDRRRGAPPGLRTRPVFLMDAGGIIDIAVHAADHVPAGMRIAGPALVEGRLTVALVPRDASAVATRNGGLLMTLV